LELLLIKGERNVLRSGMLFRTFVFFKTMTTKELEQSKGIKISQELLKIANILGKNKKNYEIRDAVILAMMKKYNLSNINTSTFLKIVCGIKLSPQAVIKIKRKYGK